MGSENHFTEASAYLGYRADIDGLRAIAVLAVIAFHAGMPGAGFVGVDVFFVISGFLITSLLLREERVDLWAFFARRARRILPAMLTVVLATVALGAVLLPAGEVVALFDSAIAGTLMVANLHVPAVSGGYFDAGTHAMPLMHLWSLGVEEQFYLAWPVVLALTPRRRLPVALGALCAASLTASHLVGGEAAFYAAPMRFWELGAGALLATRGCRGGAVHAGAGLAMLALAIALPAPTFPGIGALPAVAGAWLVIDARGAGAARLLASRPMVAIGLISYSLYLWHWPLLALDRALRVGESPLGQRLALCAAAAALAYVTYVLVEKPFRSGARGLGRRHVVVLAAGAMVATVAGLAVAAMPARERHAFAQRQDAITSDKSPLFARCPQSSEAEATMPGAECVTGSGPRTLLWGDSHAMSWEPMASAMGGEVKAFARMSCAPILGFDTGEDADKVSRCRAFNELALAEVRAGGVDRLILAARWPTISDTLPAPLQDLAGTWTAEGRERRKATGLPALRATLLAVAPHVREVVVMGPIPQLRGYIERCVALDLDCTLSRSEFEAIRGGALEQMRQAAAGIENVRVVDPSGFFCNAEECPASRGGVYLFWDDDHITSSAARAFGQQLKGRGS